MINPVEASMNLLGVSLVPFVSVLVLLVALGFCVGLFRLFKPEPTETRKRLSRELAEKIVSSHPDRYDYIPVDAASVAGLRQDELRQNSDILERMGFEKLADFQLLGVGETHSHSFGRCMLNKELCCFAEIMATRKILETSGPLIFGFSTFLSNGWSIGTGTATSLKAHFFRRLPKSLAQREPGLSLESLFHHHMALRARVISDLGLTLESLTLEGYRQKIRVRLDSAREAFLNRDILGELAEATEIAKIGRWEWLGDYPAEAVRIAKGAPLRQLQELSSTYSVPQQDALQRMDKRNDAPSDKKRNE